MKGHAVFPSLCAFLSQGDRLAESQNSRHVIYYMEQLMCWVISVFYFDIISDLNKF